MTTLASELARLMLGARPRDLTEATLRLALLEHERRDEGLPAEAGALADEARRRLMLRGAP